MLPSAFESLSDPCLPDFWINTYTAAPGAIAMTAAIIIFLVEYGSTRYLAQVDRKIAAKKAATDSSSSTPSLVATDVEAGKREEPQRITENGAHFGHHHIHPAPIEGETDASTAATQKLGVAILEAGIIFHSVFIGLTLAVSTGTDFISLFITIIFHRMSPLSPSAWTPSFHFLRLERKLTRSGRNV
jgi:solute carrier family 39 (zinc transporter), member 1/2/3